MNKILWTTEEDNLIRTYYPTRTIKQLMDLLPNRTFDAIKLRKYNLGITKRIVAEFNTDFFKNPNLQNCQVAGFISADGCICYLRKVPRLLINISSKDLQYLEKICHLLEYTGNITYRTTYNYIKNYRNLNLPGKHSISNMCALSVWNCQQWRDDLERNFSITPRKTLTLQPPKLYDLDLVLSFISGNIDGDGSVVLYDRSEGNLRSRLTISLLGTYEFLSWVKEWLNKIFPTYQRTQVKLERVGSKIYQYSISGAEAYIFSKMVLSLNILRMDRKWDKARKYIQIFESQELSGDMKIKLSKLLNNDIVFFVRNRGGDFPDNFIQLIR